MLLKFNVTQKQVWVIIHIMFSIIYFSGLFSTLVLTGSTIELGKTDLIYPAHVFAKYCDWFLIIPGAFGSLLTGIWISVRTSWGLTKYFWVMVKIIGNLGAIIFGSIWMRIWFDETISLSSIGNNNFMQNPVYLHNREMLLSGTIFSLAILTFLVIISVIKPWGKRA